VKQYSMTINIPCVREAINDDATKDPKFVFDFCQDMANASQEMFVVLDLNSKNKIIDRRLITLGLVNASLVAPREVFRGAICNSACCIICVHNHPSGDPSPSPEDIKLTKDLVESGRILGIPVMDHVVIGRGSKPYLSMREDCGYFSF
jgi:DNA repair protein RadC